MSKRYSHIFFDLDHTLWDYDVNAQLTLSDLYLEFELSKYGLGSLEFFFQCFTNINEALWADYNVGKINKFYLRDERFKLVFEAAGADMELINDRILKEFNRQYLRQCPHKDKLIDGAIELLEHLKGRYDLNIITNGFEEIQSIKLKSAGIDHYFDKVITSEKAGFKKPFNGIFYYAMKHCNALPENTIMIGDNLQTDIKGARDFGIDQAFFNPTSESHDEQTTYEINHLMDLKSLL